MVSSLRPVLDCPTLNYRASDLSPLPIQKPGPVSAALHRTDCETNNARRSYRGKCSSQSSFRALQRGAGGLPAACPFSLAKGFSRLETQISQTGKYGPGMSQKRQNLAMQHQSGVQEIQTC